MLETLTPTHVGNGDAFSNTEFIIRNNQLLRISIEELVRRIPDKELDKFSEELMEVPLSQSEILKTVDYTPAIRYALTPEESKTPKKIREHIKSADLPFIPGSSIKGSIRTALLWYHLDEQEFLESVRSSLRGSKKHVSKKFVEGFFNYRKSKYDPKFDLLKFLEVSDFMPENYELKLVNVITYSLQKDGFSKKYSNPVEACTGNFKGSFNLQENQIRGAMNQKGSVLEEKLHILGIGDEISQEKMLKHLDEVLREYNKWCLGKELDLCKKDKKNQFSEVIRGLMKLNEKQPLIRTGFGVGTVYQTLIKLLEEKDVRLARDVINKYRLGKFKRGINKFNQKEVFKPYPKTIEFTGNNEPLGWLKCQFYS